MKRPSIPFKPDAPSVHPVIGPTIQRARRLHRDERQLSEAELIADIEHELGLRPGWLDANRRPKPEGK